MDYIISDTHFLHDNIWLYNLSRVVVMSHYGMDIGGYGQLYDYIKENDKLPVSTTVSIHGHIHEDNYAESYKFNVSVDNKLSYDITNNKLGTPILFDDLNKYISVHLLAEVKNSITANNN